MGEDVKDEKRIGNEVAAREAAGFGAEAEEPFEAAALQPTRGLADAAGMKIKGGADADEDAGVERGGVRGHEGFLFRCAETDPDDVGAKSGDFGVEVEQLVGGERAVGRRKHADDAEAGEACGEFLAEEVGHAGGAAVKIVAQAGGAAGVANGKEQIGAVNAFGAAWAEPDEGHAVGRGEPGGVVDFFKREISLGLGETVGGAEADVAASEGAVRGDDGVASLREGEGGHSDAEDVVGRRG